MTTEQDRCRRCGRIGDGFYAREVLTSLFTGEVTDQTVFYCKSCVQKMEEECAFDDEMTKDDPEFAEEFRKSVEDLNRMAHEAIVRNNKIH